MTIQIKTAKKRYQLFLETHKKLDEQFLEQAYSIAEEIEKELDSLEELTCWYWTLPYECPEQIKNHLYKIYVTAGFDVTFNDDQMIIQQPDHIAVY